MMGMAYAKLIKNFRVTSPDLSFVFHDLIGDLLGGSLDIPFGRVFLEHELCRRDIEIHRHQRTRNAMRLLGRAK
jgi:hypothetical protein